MKMKNLIVAILLLFTFPTFAQQSNRSLIPYRQGNLWGYANPDKSIAIKPSYDEANWFVAGYAVVKKGTKYGYINEKGEVTDICEGTGAKNDRSYYLERKNKKI